MERLATRASRFGLVSANAAHHWGQGLSWSRLTRTPAAAVTTTHHTAVRPSACWGVRAIAGSSAGGGGWWSCGLTAVQGRWPQQQLQVRVQQPRQQQRRRVAYELVRPLAPSNSIAVCCAFPRLKRSAAALDAKAAAELDDLQDTDDDDADDDDDLDEDDEVDEDKDADDDDQAQLEAEAEAQEHEQERTVHAEEDLTALEATKQQIRARAERLAEELGLPFFAEPPSPRLSRQFEFLVEVTPDRVQVTQRKLKAPAKRMSPVYVDFVRGALSYRAKFGKDQRSPMARAVGVSKEGAPSVLDATGGLGKDAFVLASLGCRVTLVERNPVVHALLRDGLDRLREASARGDMEDNLQLVHADSTQYLLSLPADKRPDVIYIDPMYPHPKRRQKALTKIGMQLARALVGDDADANRLLEVAQQVARKRVVVKRPKYVADDPRASRAYKSARTRFEVHDATLPSQ